MLRPTPGGRSATLRRLGERLLQRRTPRRTASCLAAGNQHQELVAAPPEDVVRLADVAQQEHRDLAQDAVAGLVPERVVDRLEAIDVDEHDRQRRLVAAVALQLAADDLVEEAAVARAGQRVGDRRSGAARSARTRAAVRAAQLVGHVLERHQLHAERGDEIQRQAHEGRRSSARAGRAVRAERDPGARHGQQQHQLPTTAAPSRRVSRRSRRCATPAAARPPATSRWPGAKTATVPSASGARVNQINSGSRTRA